MEHVSPCLTYLSTQGRDSLYITYFDLAQAIEVEFDLGELDILTDQLVQWGPRMGMLISPWCFLTPDPNSKDHVIPQCLGLIVTYQ
jgi:hypothetical protein